MDQEERLLVKKAKQKDEASIVKLLRKYDPAIKKVSMYFFTKFKNIPLSFDDFKQDATIAFLKAVSTYNEEKNKSLLYFANTCMMNKLTSLVRSERKKDNIISLDETIEDNSSSKVIPCSPVTSQEEYEKLAWIRNFRDTINNILSTEQKGVWELYLQGFSYEEIAEKTGLTKKKVDNTILACKKKIIINREMFDLE
ncbi:MAG: RNA polymerase sigma-H factor [Firmicutes bacterium ADurb.Bin080]|mgnify:CR=1 FL=1|jgi:RNA polymerase sporulation-specific sigma factor|nr:sigma-70 family RNA polymerase sigma factor [Clostridiales bacterium]OQC13621.1 MAG: RNA polymerase sigma-H factor [Firmicutes bacterium ADurb.Bin080]